jgi:hypothetical protein
MNPSICVCISAVGRVARCSLTSSRTGYFGHRVLWAGSQYTVQPLSTLVNHRGPQNIIVNHICRQFVDHFRQIPYASHILQICRSAQSYFIGSSVKPCWLVPLIVPFNGRICLNRMEATPSFRGGSDAVYAVRYLDIRDLEDHACHSACIGLCLRWQAFGHMACIMAGKHDIMG